MFTRKGNGMKEQLRNLFLIQGLSRQEISQKLLIPVDRVIYLLRKFGIRKNQPHQYQDSGVKRCPACQKTKELNEFHKRKDGKPGSWCKRCMTNQALRRQQKYKAQAVEHKGGKCIVCGFNLYFGALEFHHLDPSKKEAGINKLTRSPQTKQVLQELDKCVLVCANCHRMAHGKLIVFSLEGTLLTTPW